MTRWLFGYNIQRSESVETANTGSFFPLIVAEMATSASPGAM